MEQSGRGDISTVEFIVTFDNEFIDDRAETLEGWFAFEKELAGDTIIAGIEFWEYFDEHIPLAHTAL